MFCNLQLFSTFIEKNAENAETKELREEKDKIKRLFQVMGVSGEVVAEIDNFECNRLGQHKENSTRLIKVNVKSKDTRDLILEKAPSLKEKNDLWRKIYVKKDVHPVYSRETSRIYKKMKTLKEQNPEKEVKITDGKLMVDGKVVDKNMFFH